MALSIVLAFVALATVNAKDLTVGEGGNLVYTELVKASHLVPWPKTEHVYFETDEEDEFISKIVVVDLFEGKPGTVEILEGGVGQEDVLLEFSRGGLFRGFEFQVEVYTIRGPQHKPKDKTTSPPTPVSSITNGPISEQPAVVQPIAGLDTSVPVPKTLNVPDSQGATSSTPGAVTSSGADVSQSSVPDVSSSSLPGDVSSTPSVDVTPIVPISSDTTAPPFVNSPSDPATVPSLIPVLNATRTRRQVEDDGNTTELYDDTTDGIIDY